jgi:hypothetical protein
VRCEGAPQCSKLGTGSKNLACPSSVAAEVRDTAPSRRVNSLAAYFSSAVDATRCAIQQRRGMAYSRAHTGPFGLFLPLNYLARF